METRRTGGPVKLLTAGATFTVRCHGRELAVTLIQVRDELAALRDAWCGLMSLSRSDSAFLTWEWLDTWSERFIRGNRRLFVLAVSEESELLGIAPWYCRTVYRGLVPLREIGFLGLPEAGSDYLDVLTKRAQERLVAEALLAALFGPLSSLWDTVALRDIPADSVFLARWISELRRLGKHYTIEAGSFCPSVHLPENFDAYLGQLSGHGRQAYRRKMRALLSNGCVEHVILRGEREVRCGLGEFRKLYEKRWGNNATAADLFALLDSYLARASGAWEVELSLLQVQGRAVAGLVHLTRGRTMYQYLMAIDRSFNKTLSIGNLICGMNIERAIRAGFTEYDFLKSEEDYKFQFMNHGKRSLSVTVYNRTARSLAVCCVHTAQSLAKILVR